MQSGSNNFPGLTIIAKCLFFPAFVFDFVVLFYQSMKPGFIDDLFIVFFVFECSVFATCFLIVGILRWRRLKLKQENIKVVSQGTNCAFWWTITGILYFFMGFLIFLGLVFLLFALFLWLEVLRSAFCEWHANKYKPINR